MPIPRNRRPRISRIGKTAIVTRARLTIHSSTILKVRIVFDRLYAIGAFLRLSSGFSHDFRSGGHVMSL
jgi:hypothetical protein